MAVTDADADGADPNVGRMFGHYQITQRLGQGGVGTVYAAVQPRIGKRVAIKVLRPERAGDPTTVKRFFQEARLVNEIGNRHIIDVVDFGEQEGTAYLVMELLDGEALSTRIARGRLDETTARHIGAQVASTLDQVHAIHVVHRDLKPDNVFVVNRGGDPHFVKLLDFGIAKLTGDEGAAAKLTRTGALVGTPLYMAPEQIRGGTIGPEVDVYALGCMLYEMVTGVPPFSGQTLPQLLAAHLEQPPPSLRERAPSISAEYESITMACLAKDAAARGLSAREIAQKLAAVAVETPPPPAERVAAMPAPPPSRAPVPPTLVGDDDDDVPPRNKGPLFVALGLMALIAIGATGWALWRSPTPAAVVVPEVVPPRPATDAGAQPSVALESKPAGSADVGGVLTGAATATKADAATAAGPKLPDELDASANPTGRQIRNAADGDGGGSATTPASGKVLPALADPPSPAILSDDQRERLESLKRLCQRGTLTPGECRAKRAEIIRRKQ